MQPKMFNILLFMLILSQGYTNDIPWSIYKIITPTNSVHSIENLYDNDFRTSVDIFLREKELFTLLVQFPNEYIIEEIKINAERTNDSHHFINVGFNGQRFINFNCEWQEKALSCRPPCSEETNLTSFVGKEVQWSIQQDQRQGWTRIFEISIIGRPLTNLDDEENAVNVAWKKPYSLLGQMDSEDHNCLSPYWRLFDDSPLMESPLTDTNDTLVVYFGKNYAIRGISLTIASGKDETTSKRIFYFDFLQSHVPLNIDTMCTTDDSINFNCDMTSILEDIPFNQTSFKPSRLLKVKIFGVPIHYPILTLSTTKLPISDSNASDRIELTCSVLECEEYSSTECKGKQVSCNNIQMHRLPNEEQNGKLSSFVLVSNVEVREEWKQRLDHVNVMEASKSKLVVELPRTHQYFGQYQCACESNDHHRTTVLTSSTEFSREDFATEVIFRKTYSIEYNEVTSNFIESGVIEVPTMGRRGFVHISAEGFSFHKDLEAKANWVEDNKKETIDLLYTRESPIIQFPRFPEFKDWTMNAFRSSFSTIYPDAVDNNTITYEWSVPVKEASKDTSLKPVIDVFNIVDVDKEPVEQTRAWILSKTDELLQIMVYFQHSNSQGIIGERGVFADFVFLGFSCDPEKQPFILAKFQASEEQLVFYNGSARLNIREGKFGRETIITLTSFSTSFSYELRSTLSSKNSTQNQTLLRIPPAAGDRLQKELAAADLLDVTLSRLENDPSEEKIQIEMALNLRSSVLFDHLDCSASTLRIVPEWNPEEVISIAFKSSPVLLTFTAPRHLQQLLFGLKLELDADLQRELTVGLPNPVTQSVDIRFNEMMGILSWSHLPAALWSSVKKYDVVVSVKDLACGTEETLELTALATWSCTEEGCETQFWDVEKLTESRDIPTNYTVTVIPFYTGMSSVTSSGTPSKLVFSHGQKGQSIISADVESKMPWMHTVTLLPFRKVPCLKMMTDQQIEYEDAVFEITAWTIQSTGKVQIPIEGIVFQKEQTEEGESDMNSNLGGVYKILNLQPGREYILKGAIKYPKELTDEFSAEVSFITPDDIIVTSDKIFKEPGESLTVNCSAAVGNITEFQKTVVWRRADQSRLPEGVFSRTSAFSNEKGYSTASLSIAQIDIWHSGEYGCFVEPPVEHFHLKPARPALFMLSVNDLKLDQTQLEAQSGVDVAVVCSTQRKGELQWRRSNGKTIPLINEDDFDLISANHVFAVASEDRQSLTLRIPRADQSTEGAYECWFISAEAANLEKKIFKPQSFNLHIKSLLQLDISQTGEAKFGDLNSVTCTIQMKTENSSIIWYRIRHSDDTFTRIDSTTDKVFTVTSETMAGISKSSLAYRSQPPAKGSVVCAIVPDDLLLAKQDQVERDTFNSNAVVYTSAQIDYKSVIDLAEPKIEENSEHVMLQCSGYPSTAGEKLQWAFKEVGANAAYTIGETTHPGFVDIADQERVAEIMSCFEIMQPESKATWPGFLQTDSTDEHFRPDKISIRVLSRFGSQNGCGATIGQIVCQYRLTLDKHASSVSPDIRRPITVTTAEDGLWLEDIRRIITVLEKGSMENSLYGLDSEKPPVLRSANTQKTNRTSASAMPTLLLLVSSLFICWNLLASF